MGAKDVGERIFTGRPDPGTTIKINEGAPNTLAVSWTEWGTPLTLSLYYESTPEFDSEKINYAISSLTVSDGVVTDTYRPVWTTRAGFPFTTNKEEALLPVKQSNPNFVGVLTFKNISWYPGLYPLYDLDYAKWSWKHVQKILPTRIMTPVADGLFDPEGEITRASMATFLIRAYEYITGRSTLAGETPFTDIGQLPPDVQTAIKKIYGLKITAGTSATTYSPEIKINRAQMATFLSNLYKALYGEYAPEVPVPFTDIGGGDITWAQKPIARIYGLKVTAGVSPTQFGPYLNVTREQMATFIMNFIELTQRKPLPTVSPTPSHPPIPSTPLPTTETPKSTIMPSPSVCVDRCGDRVCQSIVCQGEGCSCAESTTSCPSDCGATPTLKPTADVERVTQSFSDLIKELVSPAPSPSPIATSAQPAPLPPASLSPSLVPPAVPPATVTYPAQASPAQVSIFVQIITLVQNFFQSLFR
ncbi:S-layer homology domain-containing protein [Candidatus Gottesmanbacteria bacterium]|nr:S-layer homology domain-containing protein [Candidatus Gottesmanbacteria bacterium]